MFACYICHRVLLLTVTFKEIRQTPVVKIYHNKRYLLTIDLTCNLDFTYEKNKSRYKACSNSSTP